MSLNAPQETSWMERARCPSTIVVVFTQQLALMLRSGVSLADALGILSHQPEHENFGEVVLEVLQQVASGYRLSIAMSRFPLIFDQVYLSMVRVGENTGGLAVALDRLALWLEGDRRLRQRVTSALTYPVFVILLSGLLTFVLFNTVLPSLLEVFEGMDVDLPIYTRVVLALTRGAKNPGITLVIISNLVMITLSIREYYKTRRGALHLFRMILKVPVVGPIVKYSTTSRYASSASALLACGVDLHRTLRLAAQASGSPLLIYDAENLCEAVMEGELPSAYMTGRPDIYPSMLTQMVMTAEETSRYSAFLARASDFFDAEVEFKIEVLAAALEPILLGMVAGFVGFVLLSIFVPLYGMIDKVG